MVFVKIYLIVFAKNFIHLTVYQAKCDYLFQFQCSFRVGKIKMFLKTTSRYLFTTETQFLSTYYFIDIFYCDMFTAILKPDTF